MDYGGSHIMIKQYEQLIYYSIDLSNHPITEHFSNREWRCAP